jgi:hypothetical protein
MLERSIPVVNESNQLDEVMFVEKAAYDQIKDDLLHLLGHVKFVQTKYGGDSNGIHQALYGFAEYLSVKHYKDNLKIQDKSDNLSIKLRLKEALTILLLSGSSHSWISTHMAMPYEDVLGVCTGGVPPTQDFIKLMSKLSGKPYDWFFT